jgi:hypothetical protein
MWKINRFVNILLWVLAVISVGLCIWAFIGCGNASTREEMMDVINPMMIWSYILVAIAAIIALCLPIPQMIENPKSAVGVLGGVLALGAVIGISYLFSSGYLDSRLVLPTQEAPGTGIVKFADVNLISTYIMLGATILVMIASSIINVVKMR